MSDREPYEKPEARLIDLGNLLDECDRMSKEIEEKFATLRGELEELVVKIQSLDLEADRLVDLVQDLVQRHAKAQAIVDLKQEAGHP